MLLPRRPRLVVDANVWVSYLLTRSFPGLVHIIRSGRAVFLISEGSIAELQDVLDRPKFKKLVPPELGSAFIALLYLSGNMIHPRSRQPMCRDPKDDHLLNTALDGSADLIITGDLDLLSMDPFRGIRIISPSAFLRAFK